MPESPAHRPAELSEAFAFCRKKSLEAGSSFHPAFIFLSRPQREALFAVYYFCRRVDDAVDELEDPAASREELTKLEAGISGERSGALWLAMENLIEQYQIPRKYFYQLIEGMRFDLGRVRVESWKELDRYCYLVAGTVGLIMLHIFGTTSGPATEAGKALARAVQLTNILRDLAEDRQRDRCYLPIFDGCHKAAVEGWIESRMTVELQQVFHQAVDRSTVNYRQGLELLPLLGWRHRLTIGMMTARYNYYLKQLKQPDFNPWEAQLDISSVVYPVLLWKVLRATLGDAENCLFE